MGPTKIMIIRHAEKPNTYGGQTYQGVNALGASDDKSLVTLGWERAGALGNLFDPTNGQFQNPELAKPDFIYAADPADKHGKEPSERPYQTISALAAKLKLTPNTSFKKDHFPEMVASVLALQASRSSCTVLISWQHQDILPAASGAPSSIVTELVKQTQTASLPGIPKEPWPGNRYDMVFVFDRPSGTGPLTSFRQVPQMLLAGDSATLFS